MNPIVVPESYNYISAFLTFACNFKCHYCINKYGTLAKHSQMSPDKWIAGLNRIVTPTDKPITLTGGEPTLYKGFYDLVDGIRPELSLDLLTNGSFDVDEFMKRIPPNRMRRDAKYASIRISYHPGYTDEKELERVARALNDVGYSVGIWAVEVGVIPESLKSAFEWYGIDFRTKDYLDATHGNYKYPKALDGFPKKCLCKPSELLIGPDGNLYRCHADLYRGVNSYAHILDEDINLPEDFLPCNSYGLCNPCDIKTKFNRYQEEGHCAVEIDEKTN